MLIVQGLHGTCPEWLPRELRTRAQKGYARVSHPLPALILPAHVHVHVYHEGLPKSCVFVALQARQKGWRPDPPAQSALTGMAQWAKAGAGKKEVLGHYGLDTLARIRQAAARLTNKQQAAATAPGVRAVGSSHCPACIQQG